ncbi:hypothetical protein OROMI_015354 [Orobanche minor]
MRMYKYSLAKFLVLFVFCLLFTMDQTMPPRWKGEVSEAKALAEPMSLKDCFQVVVCSFLQHIPSKSSSLTCHISAVPLFPKERIEEALYLCSVMKCIEVIGENKHVKNEGQLWRYATSKRVGFAFRFKAYSHLRMKNWVVTAGSQYGVDFVAYRHHPALVHSEYGVIVLSDEDEGKKSLICIWAPNISDEYWSQVLSDGSRAVLEYTWTTNSPMPKHVRNPSYALRFKILLNS